MYLIWDREKSRKRNKDAEEEEVDSWILQSIMMSLLPMLPT
jgi:hypothetical protein